MTTLNTLNAYGNSFQVKVLGALLTQRSFLLNIVDSLDSEFFESSAHKWIVDFIIEYFNKYHTYPTMETVSIQIKKIENEVLKISLIDSLREAYKMADVSDLEWVENEFSNFCRNQQMKKAIMTSVDLLNMGDYEGIHSIISSAMKAGEEKNIGHIYDKDVEQRYREDDRNPIPFPWQTLNDLTQGGPGKGDLVLIFGNPKGGKSWVVAAIGAFAAEQGFNVLHYSLELTEGYLGKRYDAILTGIDVDKLDEHKDKVEEAMKNLKGKVIIKGYPPRRASFDTIEAHIEQLKNQEEFVPDLIIIDYLDYVRTKSRKDRKEEIDDVYVHAKGLAGELGIPIISPSQANRTGAKEDILEAEHAAGSYDKIMIADILISLARNRKDKIKGTGKFHIMGNRYGPDGLTFNSRINTFNGDIEIFPDPLDDDFEENKKDNFSDVDDDEKWILRNKFKKFEKEKLV